MSRDWKFVKLGQLCSPKNRIARASKVFAPDEEIQYIDISSIDNSIQKMMGTTLYTMKEAPSRAQQKVERGDILISTVRPNLKNVAMVMSGDSNQVASSGFCVLRTLESVNRDYLFHYVKTDHFTNYLTGLTTGANYPAVKDQDIFNAEIPLPSIDLQKRIVVELDKIKSLLDLKSKQLEIYDKLAQSLFYEMFGDPVENEKGWEASTIKQVCSSIVRGPFGSALKKEFFVEPDNTTYKVYEQKHAIQKDWKIGSYYVTEDKFKELSRFELNAGDIIMSCSGTIGELYRIPICAEKGLMNQALLKFTLNKRIEYIYFLFLMDFVKRDFIVRGTGLQNIGSVKIIKGMPLGLPPLPLQQLFATRIEAIEQQKAQVKTAIEKLETLLAARMQYWFE